MHVTVLITVWLVKHLIFFFLPDKQIIRYYDTFISSPAYENNHNIRQKRPSCIRYIGASHGCLEGPGHILHPPLVPSTRLFSPPGKTTTHPTHHWPEESVLPLVFNFPSYSNTLAGSSEWTKSVQTTSTRSTKTDTECRTSTATWLAETLITCWRRQGIGYPLTQMAQRVRYRFKKNVYTGAATWTLVPALSLTLCLFSFMTFKVT